jgi:hypothetical protein
MDWDTDTGCRAFDAATALALGSSVGATPKNNAAPLRFVGGWADGGSNFPEVAVSGVLNPDGAPVMNWKR